MALGLSSVAWCGTISTRRGVAPRLVESFLHAGRAIVGLGDESHCSHVGDVWQAPRLYACPVSVNRHI